MAKNLITILQMNLMPNPSGGGNADSPELLLLIFLPLTYYHSHFLAATLDFTSFFILAFLGATQFFLQLGCFGLDIKTHDSVSCGPRSRRAHSGYIDRKKENVIFTLLYLGDPLSD